MTTSGHMTKLVELAQAKSSDSRRALLHEITDLFMEEPGMRTGQASVLSDQIITQIADDMEEAVRAELAERFADIPDAPRGLVRSLALDAAAAVARPVLQRSTVLDDQVLVEVARSRGSEHLGAIAGRAEVSEIVSAAVVARGDEQSLVSLAQNPNARLSRRSFEEMVDHAETIEALQQPLVNREETPPDLLSEMYLYVQEALRERILERSAELSPEEFERALAAAQARMQGQTREKPSDYNDAVKFVRVKKLRKKLTQSLLRELLQQRERTKFIVAFADLADLDFTASRRIMDNPAVDPLAIACKAAGFDREEFIALAMLRSTDGARTITDPEGLGAIYDAMPAETAERAMRFWRVRREASAAA